MLYQDGQVIGENLAIFVSDSRLKHEKTTTLSGENSVMKPQIRLLRHFLATLAYRMEHVMQGAPEDFARFDAGNGVRSPGRILEHVNDVLGFTLNQFRPDSYSGEHTSGMDAERALFHDLLRRIGEMLQQEEEQLSEETLERILQGPLADAMTHVGQLAMLRRLAGSPVPPENYFRAGIAADVMLGT